jgi:predicted Rossmann fold nucleotide-binding protein DprA/Smf involved in DNA uptake
MNSLVIWERQINALTLVQGVGAESLLDMPMTAFFASRQCTGAAIRLGMDWALAQGARKHAVISGFHSPLEQSILTVMLQAKSPVVAVLARAVGDAKLPVTWQEPLQQGLMAVVSGERPAGRLTAAQAMERNQLAASLAGQIVVAHASPGGQLECSCECWTAQGMRLEKLT